MLDARQIADWFIRRAGRDGRILSIMTLLKLIYISHGWHLEIFKVPLFRNRIEAWKFGPVVPEAYNAYRTQGVNISSPIGFPGPTATESQVKLLEEIYSIYGGMGAFTLSEITHVKDGPWDIASREGHFAHIPNGLIQAHYEELRVSKSAENG